MPSPSPSTDLTLLLEYLVVPVILLAINYALNGHFSLKYSAGSDFFTLYLSADVVAIMERDTLLSRVNPRFQPDFLAVFVALSVLMFFMLVIAANTQRRLDAYKNRGTSYPLTGVLLCWVATLALLPTHLYLFFGR